MNLEKLEKHIHPDANKNLSVIQVLFWWVCIIIPFFAFMIISGFALLSYFTSNNESYNISNIGFAILIGLASICFSYYKLLENSNYAKLHKDVQRSGEFFLISAIAFLISSALKYSWTKIDPGSPWLQRVGLRIAFGYTFFVAESICIVALAKLIDVLYIRVTNPNH